MSSVPDIDLEQLPPRYVVGIDLGTTNSAVALVDTERDDWRVEVFRVSQLVAPGEVEARETLPSFHYQPASGEFADEALQLPWTRRSKKEEKGRANHFVGVFARDHGAEVPGRLVASAKSWLCHTGVDRTAELLPWHGAADVERLSPVEVSSRVLAHVRRAWDHAHPDHPLADQDVVLTLPASFDEVARELTIEAAQRAGLPRVVLIEEPQAAFYAWVHLHAGDWQEHVTPGQKILVCDIGGGTSDFTLIRVRRGEDGKVHFHRIAVGDHLILGGDNLDLTLAHHLENRLAGGDKKLAPRQFDVLVRRCQMVKETLLGEQPPEKATVSVPGSGAKLIGGALKTEVARDEARELLLDGFFPRVALSDKPASRVSGFQEFGLPYATDAAVTRHLAAFLTAHREVGLESPEETKQTESNDEHDPARPDILLLNGGLFESAEIRQRIIDVIASWFSAGEQSWSPQMLQNDRLSLAVARGAAYYGMVRRGEGVKISAELARTYYVGIESDPPRAVCLVPGRAELGEDVELVERPFELLVDQPVEFPLLVSSTRLTDEPGEVFEVDREQMKPLAPIRTVLQVSRRKERGTVRVHLHARLTEIGTLQLWCSEADGERRWRLEFDVRSATQTDIAAHEGTAETMGVVDEEVAQAARDLILSVFGPDACEKPSGLVKQLSRTLDASRWDWPPSLLRRMWETLIECEPGRRKSQHHEARWLNLTGFALRPGYGLALDDWRVAETWRLLHGKLAHGTPMARTEWWILWRRIAGGFSAGQQRALADPLLAQVRGLHKRMTTGRGGTGDLQVGPEESIEIWRLFGSLELLPVTTKIELGEMVLDLLPKRKMQHARAALSWTLGRLGTRMPLYGPLNVVVPADTVSQWLTRLMQSRSDDAIDTLAVMQMARRTGDRYRDIGEEFRGQVLDWLTDHRAAEAGAAEHYGTLVREGGRLDDEEQGRVFGESLPKGLRLA